MRELELQEEAVAERQINRLVLWLVVAFALTVGLSILITQEGLYGYNYPPNLAGLAVLTLYNIGLFLVLRRGVQRPYFKVLTVTVMVSTVSFILTGYAALMDWVQGLRTVVVVLYFVPVLISAHYKSPWLSHYTAILASLQYLVLFSLAVFVSHTNVVDVETFRNNAISWDVPAALVPALLACGYVASLHSNRLREIVRELLTREAESLQLMAERLRAQEEKEKADKALLVMVPQLKQQKQELEALTRELHHQVATRSRELTNVLALVSQTAAPNAVEVGDVFEDRYRIIRQLGSGGMGVVFEAQRTTDNLRFALKVATQAVSGRQAARFTQEAEIGSRISHPNLVTIVDVGVSVHGSPYLVMNLEDGSLEKHRHRFGDTKWATPLLKQVAEGLSELHKHGVVHRDLKPENIMLSRVNGRTVARIGDYGIASFTLQLDSQESDGGDATPSPPSSSPLISHTGTLVGTPSYMPPGRGANLGSSGDIFSFGMVAYEMLSGTAPFSTPPVFLVRARQPLPVPDRLNAEGVPPLLADTIVKCLRENPDERPSSAEVLSVLRSIDSALAG